MKFNSIEETSNFWNNYGGKMRFGVRKAYMNKSEKDNSTTTCRFVCSKEGVRREDKRDHLVVKHRPERRTNCKVKFGVRNVNGKFRVYDLEEEHNHELHLPQTSHMLASQRRLSEVQQQEIDLARDAGLQQRATFDLMSRQAGGRGNIGFTRLDQKNYLRTKRQKSMIYGEVGFLMEYFQEQSFKNPSFFHSYQMDLEQQITNIFWADARMLLDYRYFGEVVSFDTTYCTNSAHRPLSLFGGLNHHRETIIFGVALLFDETTASFKWLFETFLTAHNFKKPQTIFTDQDQAMAKALSEVMPEIKHGLCTWHLKQNGIKHLAGKMKGRSHFLKDFTWYMYHCVEESQFEEGLRRMLTEYNFEENKWLKSVYDLKEKWAASYMKRSLTLGMQSTQVSESINSEFKNFLTSSNASFMEFFKHFECFLDNKRYNELNSEFKVRELLSTLTSPRHPLLKQLAKAYTTNVIDKFQPEWILKDACYIKKMNEEYYEYIIGMVDEEGEWRVMFLNHPEQMSISCSCRKFESWGFLCSHALKVLDSNDVKHLPSHYILKRWTREARCGIIYDVEGKGVDEDLNLILTQ